MQPTFFRIHTDGTRHPVAVENLYAGPFATWCWLVGGGPSLEKLPYRQIAASPVPKMAVNLAGTGRIRPDFWTAYDRSSRFLTSLYLDATITKFLPLRRAMDLVPGTTVKVCECPATLFFERDGGPGFADFLNPQRAGIVDWADTLVMAIDILYRLGFRRMLLAGCEMRVRPSPRQIALARQSGVEYDAKGLLQHFLQRCAQAGVSAEELDRVGPARLYHFDEFKPIAAAAQTDLHYFRVAQYLRLARRNLASAGVELISVTPDSRLNDYFPYMSVRRALERMADEFPVPRRERTRGLYRELVDRRPARLGPMRDYRPHNWGPIGPKPRVESQESKAIGNSLGNDERLGAAVSPPVSLLVEQEGLVLGDLEPQTPHDNQERLLRALEAIRRRHSEVCEEG